MLFTSRNREDLEKLEEQSLLKYQVEDLRLQDKLGKQIFHERMKILYQLFANSIKDTSRGITKTTRETFINRKKALEQINEKVLELMNNKGMIAPYLTSSLVNLFFKPENTSQSKLIKEPNSIGLMNFLINRSIPVSLCSNMLTFKDNIEFFK